MDLFIIALIVALGFSHAVEPDHIVTLRLMKTKKDYALFGLSHGVGFALIAIPLATIFSFFHFLEIVGDIIGLGFSLVLLYSEIIGKEIEFNVIRSFGSGIIQGAFAITPSKVIVAILASEVGLLLGSLYITLFIFISSITLFLVGMTLSFFITLKADLSRYINVGIAIVTIIYILISIIK